MEYSENAGGHDGNKPKELTPSYAIVFGGNYKWGNGVFNSLYIPENGKAIVTEFRRGTDLGGNSSYEVSLRKTSTVYINFGTCQPLNN
jgi:hypothetical protein|tara:strand:- start:335 stop:598 length:264 start_codon:yes stop_codon:yes gene_type:complete